MGAGSSSASSDTLTKRRPAVRSVNAFCSFFTSAPLMNKSTSSDKTIMWEWFDSLGVHRVELQHDQFTGRRSLCVDGVMIRSFDRSHALIKLGGLCTFYVGAGGVQLTPEGDRHRSSTKVVVAIVESGLQFGYALSINDHSFARAREEAWRYATLFYVPKKILSQPVAAPSQVFSPFSPQAEDSARRTFSFSQPIPPPPAPSAASSLDTEFTLSRRSPVWSIVVLSRPELCVLVDGRVVDMHSSFGSTDDEHDLEAEGNSSSEARESTQHMFTLNWAVQDVIDLLGLGVAAEEEDIPSADHPTHQHVPECVLSMWLEKSENVPSSGLGGGAMISSRVPREKKEARCRFSLRVDGTLVGRAQNPLLGILHADSLTGSSDYSNSGSSGTGGDGAAASLTSPAPSHTRTSSSNNTATDGRLLARSATASSSATSSSSSSSAPPGPGAHSRQLSATQKEQQHIDCDFSLLEFAVPAAQEE